MPTPPLTPFTVYTGSDATALTNALLAPGSGIVITSGSIVLKASGQDAVNFYDPFYDLGSNMPLGIGAGLLLTSGTTPGITNTVGWFGTDNSIWPTTFYNGDADIDAVVNTVFQTQSFDATTLEFDFSVADPTATSISFDLVFGSDEYPEWVDQFVDSAVVMVNGVNYALFNHDPLHPLSVVSANLAAGYFQDNALSVLPIEYDGVSHVLKIVAPIKPGGASNHIKIGIADTGDHIYDSGIFLANLSAGNIPGSGVVITPPAPSTDNSDNVTGTSKDEYFDLKGGDDTCYAGAGDDIVVAGSGNDSVYGGSGNDEMKGDSGDDNLDGGDGLSDTSVYSGALANYSVAYNAISASFTIIDNNIGPGSEGTDTLINVELAKFSDGLFALGAGGLTPVADPGTPPSNTPGSVVISGVGSVGKTLTATVSDPDSVSGEISYQWQVSGDNGVNWTSVGSDSNTYTILTTDVGKIIQVAASYIDNGLNAESPVSAQKAILEANNGDLVVTLMQLRAPLGASNINPLTTLMQDAIDLGLSPNQAALGIKAVLGLPDEINLPTYDAYAVLLSVSNDPIALLVEKVAVQVAILTSLSDDDTGVNLTLAIVNAAANNQTLNLANESDLTEILGPPTFIDDLGRPQPITEILDRNSSMSDAIADGGDVSVIEKEWQDLLSIQDGIDSTSIADLSIHVNQAPTGSAIASLANGLEDTAYIIDAGNLLQGFSDSDGGVIQVSDLTADTGGALQNNLDGTWTFTPATNYSGPVELTYTVIDGQGGSAPASQLFAIAPSPLTLTGDESVNEGANYVLHVAATDPANTNNILSYSIDWGDESAVQTLTAVELVLLSGDVIHIFADDENGPNNATPRSISVTANDSGGGSSNQTKVVTVNNVAPDLSAAGAATGIAGALYTLTLSDYVDPGQDALAANGISIDWGDGNTQSVNILGDVTHTYIAVGTPTISVSLTDEDGSFADVATLTLTVASGNVAPVADDETYTMRPGQTLTIAAPGILDGDTDADGDALSVSLVNITGLQGALNPSADGSFTFTPNAGFVGTTSFTYTVVDGQGGIDEGLVTIAVVNSAPVADDETYTMRPGQTLTIAAPGILDGDTDADGDALSVSLVNITGLQGALNPSADGSFTFTPNAGFVGTTSFTYTVRDGQGGFDEGLVTIDVISALSLEAGPNAALNEGDTFSRILIFNDGKDNAAAGWSYSVDYGDGSINTGITLVNTLALNHQYIDGNANRTVAVILTDEAGETASDSFQVSVNNVAPSIALSGVSHVNEDTVYTLDLGAINDPGQDQVSAYSVNWGDGLTSNYTPEQVAALTGKLTHTYADGPAHRTINVGLTDDDGVFDHAGSLDVDVYGVVKLGDAPTGLNSSNPNAWINAWTKTGIDIQHKADYANTATAWSAITKNVLAPSVLTGGDLFAGDLGVSGQSSVTSSVKQEIDCREALRFTLADLAGEASINLSRFFQHDDGSQLYNESGRLQAFNGEALVHDLNFTADSVTGKKTISLQVDQGFDSLILTAGDYDGENFISGAYAKDDGSFGSAPYSTGTTQHGSDFLVDLVLIGIQPPELII